MKTAAMLIAALIALSIVCVTIVVVQDSRRDVEIQIAKLRLQQTCELTRSVIMVPHAAEGATEADRPSVWRGDVAGR